MFSFANNWIQLTSSQDSADHHHYDPRFRIGSCIAIVAIDLLFLVGYVVSFVRRRGRKKRLVVKSAYGFNLFLAACFYVLVCYIGLALWVAAENRWFLHRQGLQLSSLLTFVEALVQVFAWIAALGALLRARDAGEKKLPVILRGWWLASFFTSLLNPGVFLILFRYFALDVWLGLASFPAKFILLVASLLGSIGICYSEENGGLEEPLLLDGDDKNVKVVKGEDQVTPYSTAGFWSLLILSWVSPLLAVGAKKPLETEDIPQLSDEHRASKVYEEFLAKWENAKKSAEASGGKPPSLAKTILQCYWKEALLVGILVVIDSVAVYVGPYLIDDFVTYLSGVKRFKHEGVMLVTIFVLTKLLENFCQRHWFVQVQFLALKLRSVLMACVYRKGLRLSNPSRQSHTSGEIVNYMAVDIQRVTDFTWYMHDVWMIPAQVILALCILYKNVGVAAVATIVATIGTVAANFPFSQLLDKYQDKIMEAKDVRMRSTTECLRSMKILKLQAWEKAYLRKLHGLRDVEYGWLKKSFYTQAVLIFIFWTSPMIVGVFTFGTCVVLKIPLTAGRVLSALATFRVLSEPLANFPDFISASAQARVSLERLRKFLHESELQADAVSWLPKEDGSETPMAIQVQSADFSWDGSEEKLSLFGINLAVREGMTVAVCGMVGSGKSSLLSCLLGEMPKLSGNVQVKGRTAYVGQTAWIQSGKIEDNVLFGSSMDQRRYDYVLEICQLKKDLEVLPFGDQTEIGERGINLSGGQKQRIQLARAVYQDADIYLLDDPFSAVDVQTGTQIFKECVLGALASKTVILVTHQVEFLPIADLILVMKDGRIAESGTYHQLLKVEADFSKLVGAHNKAMDAVNMTEKAADLGDSIEGILDNDENKEKEGEHTSKQEPETKVAQLVQEEERERGSVGLKVYWNYCTAVYKGGLIPCIIGAQLCFQLLQIASNWWMAKLTPTTSEQSAGVNSRRLILGYGLFSLGASLFVLLRVLLMNVIGLLTAQKFFFNMLECIFHAPMSFFDSTPTGRILNRASTDQSALDLNVPYRLGGLAFAGIQLLCIVGVMSQAVWQVLIAFVPVLVFCILLQQYYITSGRELTRLQGVQKAPILHNFSESVAGAPTIRGFGQEQRFMGRNMFLIDTSARVVFYSAAAMEWASLRLELLTNVVFSCCLILLVCLPPGVIAPGIAGLAVTYGLNLNVIQSWFIWNLCMAERYIVSVERIQQYSRIESEAPWEIEDKKPHESWPATGNVSLVELKVRYNQNSPLVLHGLSCEFPGGKKIGVVGRTGSGKSTLIQAIFRIIEPAGGTIIIDSVDITQIGLHDLRSKLSIIPQEPTLFEGTVRYNLDPLGQYSDAEIWEALDKCQLGDIIRSKDEKLEAPVTENGENWSVGQRQLFCLGRVMLKHAQVLLLDEATASVDSATDGVIQSTIATKFQGCTVITIAHRLPTVIDSDYVLVLSDGRIAEYDEPAKLLENNSSHFHKLVSEYSKRSFEAESLEE